MAGKRFGIDPGTMNLRICQAGQGLIINEKNFTAIRRKNVIASGNAAYEMYERTPASIRVRRPVEGGVISDIDLLSRSTESLLKKKASSGLTRSNQFYIAVPTDVTEVEKRAYFNLITHTSFNTRHVYLIEKPIASAIGEGLYVSGNIPVMLVDMGAGSTEITIMMNGGIAVSTLLKEGGLTIDETIRQSVKKEYELIIGEKTAEYLKLELGSAIPASKRSVKVFGRSMITGLPASAEVPVTLVFEAMRTYFTHVVSTIHNMIGKIPPQYASYILEKGIYVTGGTSRTPELPRLFESILNMKAVFSPKPEDSAIRGVEKMMQDPSQYKDMIFSLRELSYE